MAIEIVPLEKERLEEAASLAARGHQAEIDLEPNLPAGFADTQPILGRLQNIIERGPGVAAIRDGELVGFLTGFNSLFRGVRTAYSPNWGHGAAPVGRIPFDETVAEATAQGVPLLEWRDSAAAQAILKLWSAVVEYAGLPGR